jgi:hypothetical protein
MVDTIDFQPYLQSLCRHYNEWCRRYTVTDVEGKEVADSDKNERVAPFNFGLMVKSKLKDPEVSRHKGSEKPERRPVIEGLRKSLAEAKHVLLIGRPDSIFSQEVDEIIEAIFVSQQRFKFYNYDVAQSTSPPSINSDY